MSSTSAHRPSSRRRLVTWLVGFLAAMALIVAGVVLLPRVIGSALPLGSSSESTRTEVIQSVKTERQVILLRLTIQGIEEAHADTTFAGVKVPLTGRALFLMYSFKAQLGFDGKDLQITPRGDHDYEIALPSFQFLGHDGVEFKVATEQNSALAWVTPEIDKVAMVNAILNSDAQRRYVEQNRDVLRLQAQDYYRSIIQAVDPKAQVTFTFTG